MNTNDLTPMERRAATVAALRQAGSNGISGEVLARQLGISRAAVGKHISALREDGYVISSTPGVGYTLKSVPNLPLPFEVFPCCMMAIATCWVARRPVPPTMMPRNLPTTALPIRP